MRALTRALIDCLIILLDGWITFYLWMDYFIDWRVNGSFDVISGYNVDG